MLRHLVLFYCSFFCFQVFYVLLLLPPVLCSKKKKPKKLNTVVVTVVLSWLLLKEMNTSLAMKLDELRNTQKRKVKSKKVNT